MSKLSNAVTHLAILALGGIFIFLYSVIYSVLVNMPSMGPSNPGGTQVPLNGPYPAYWQNLQAFNQFPNLGFFENHVERLNMKLGKLFLC